MYWSVGIKSARQNKITGFSLETFDMCESFLGCYDQPSAPPLQPTFILLLIIESSVVSRFSLVSCCSEDSTSSRRGHGAQNLTSTASTSRLCYSINVIHLHNINKQNAGDLVSFLHAQK